MTDVDLFNSAYQFLLLLPGVTEADLKLHLEVVPASNKPKNINLIYRQLCQTAQNKQMSPNVIGQAVGGFENLGRVLSDFDPFSITEKYSTSDSQLLFDEIKKRLKPKGQLRDSLNSEWPKYCTTVLEGAYFIKGFGTSTNFYSWADKFANDEKSKYALPLLISLEVKGFGFPLACDFLKEVGYIEYGKPDVHLRDIFLALSIVNESTASTVRRDYLIAKAIDKIATANQVTPFAVDKIFWLIGSGNFYLTGQKTGNNKEKFIKQMKSQYGLTEKPLIATKSRIDRTKSANPNQIK